MQNSNFDIPNFDAPPTSSGLSSFSNDRNVRWDSNIQWFDWRPGWNLVRLFGPNVMAYIHWIQTTGNKMLPILCRNFDVAAGAKKPAEECDCPVCTKIIPKVNEMSQNKTKWAAINKNYTDKLYRTVPKKVIYTHLIDRSGTSGRPWLPAKLTYSVAFTIGRLKELNKIMYQGKEYMCDIDDVNYGRDINVNYDPNNSDPGKKYQVAPADSKPLTDIERNYLREIYDFKKLITMPSVEEIEKILSQQKIYETLTLATNEFNANGGGVPAQQAPWQQQAQAQQAPWQQAPQAAPQWPPQQAQQQAPAWAQPVQQPQQPQQAPAWAQPVQQPQQPQQPQQAPAWAQPAQPVQQPQQAPAWAQPVQQPQMMPPPSQGGFSSAVGQSEAMQPPSMPFASQPPMPSFNVPPPFAAAKDLDVPDFPSAMPSQTYSVQGKPVSREDFQKTIAEFGKSVVGSTKQWDGNDDLKGFEVASCYGAYAGNATCIRCPARKQCLMIGSDT